MIKTIKFDTYLDTLKAIQRAKEIGYTIKSKEFENESYFSELPAKSVYYEYTVRIEKGDKIYVFWTNRVSIYNRYGKAVK